MRLLQGLAYAVAVGLGLSRAAPDWGGGPQWSCSVNMTNPADSLTRPVWRFDYSYDWTLQSELYRHAEGNGDEVCKGVVEPQGAACSVLNVPNQTFVFWGPPNSCKCCKFEFPLGAIRMDWIARSGGQFLREEIIHGFKTQVWTAQGQYLNYYAATDDDSHQPVRFWEHKGLLLKQWDFQQESFRRGPLPHTQFTPPECCRAVHTCKSEVFVQVYS